MNKDNEFVNHRHNCELLIIQNYGYFKCPKGFKQDEIGDSIECDKCKHMRIFNLTDDGNTITDIASNENGDIEYETN